MSVSLRRQLWEETKSHLNNNDLVIFVGRCHMLSALTPVRLKDCRLKVKKNREEGH